MAKNKVKVDVEIKDNSTLKDVGNKAKKTAKELDKTAGSSRNVDRAMKGASKQSSNSTKNFSKMAQGMSGGLVPAYATLAAQIFAVSAAFQFLQNAFDFNNLIKGQEALGSVTGTTYKTISNSLVEATAGQLKYADAAKAAAIGTASGLTAGQLTQLSTAAKNTSLALGRDLTDSFNRLIRGVTKAEPELLDELGIILRLDTATRKYAQAIGKPASALNEFERSQAVANEVLEQAEKKFSAVGEAMSDEALALNQFLKSFDDLANTVKVVLAEALTPLFSFLSKNTGSLTAALGLFAIPIIKSIIPNLQEWEKSATKASKKQIKAYNKQKAAFTDLTKVTKAEYQKQKATANLQKELADLSFRKGSAGAKLQAGESIGLRQAVGLRGSMEKSQAFQGLDPQAKARIKADLDTIVRNSKSSADKIKLQWKSAGAVIGNAGQAAKVAWAGAMSGISKASKLAAVGIDKAFKAVSFIGIALMLIDLGKAAYDMITNYFNPVTEATKKLQEETERLQEKYKDLESELESSRILRIGQNFFSFRENVESVGAALQGVDVLNFVKDLNNLDRTNQAAVDQFTKIATEIGFVDATFAPLLESLKTGKDVTEDQTKAMVNYANGLIQVGLASKSVAALEQEVGRALTGLSSNLSSTPFDTLKLSVEDLFEAQSTTFKGMQDNIVATDAAGRSLSEILETVGNAGGQDLFKDYKEFEKTLNVTKSLNIAVNEAAKKYVESQKQQRDNQIKIADLTTLGITLEERRSNIEANRLTTKNKILGLETATISPLVTVNALLAEGVEEEDQRLVAARLALQVSIDNLNIGRAQAEVEEYRRLQQEYLLSSEERLLGIKKEQFDITKRNNALDLATERNKLGISGTFGFGRAREQRTIGTSALQGDIAAQQALNKELEDNVSRNLYSSEIEKQADEAALEAGRQKLRLLNLQIEARNKVAEITLNELRSENQITAAQLAGTSLNPVQQAFNERMIELKKQGKELSLADQEKLYQEVSTQKELMLLLENKQQLFTSIADSISGALNGLIDGTKSVKQAFADMALNILKDIGQMIVRMMVFRTLSGLPFFNQGPTMPASMGMTDTVPNMGQSYAGFARTGGVFSQGKEMSGYADGGISKGSQAGYPVMLHGTEAVVPLPNGRAIPVEMKGSNQSNNVTVNVSVDNQGNASTNSQQDSAQAGNLGQVIARAVQQELQNQKRSGGILSPYGAA